MFVDLDEPSGLDPVKVGSKAAALAAARAAGVDVLPGFVVEAAASRRHLELGAATLASRGSGGARLVVAGEPIDGVDELMERGSSLGSRLVVRSSTLLERSGEWSGAFTSYLDLTPADLPKAVVGCWASAFTVAALERQEAAGVEPGTWPMPVLIQPVLHPDAGGWAELDDDGTVTVYGVEGSPAPLLQGWVSGHRGRYDGEWSGDLVEVLGADHLDSIRSILVKAAGAVGANRCEWALTDRVWVLQLGSMEHGSPEDLALRSPLNAAVAAGLVDTVRAVVLAPGVLGEELVLSWAIAGLPTLDVSAVIGPEVTLTRAAGISQELTEQVWGLPWVEARTAAERLMAQLRGADAAEALGTIRSLKSPDPAKAARLLGILETLRHEMVQRGVVASQTEAWHLGTKEMAAVLEGGVKTVPVRLGLGRWEPPVAAVVLSAGERRRGVPASPGVGAGPCLQMPGQHPGRGARRSVITSADPTPNQASLLWDAAGLVTETGSPAAHLFEAARALRVPAVCGVSVDWDDDAIVAVDGDTGHVASIAGSIQ